MANSAASVLSGLTATSLFDLRGVVAVVTGGSSGIGLMISSTLVANGAKVYIVGLDQAQLDGVAKVYNDGASEGMGKMIGVQGDVSKKAEAARVASLIAEREPGGITVLFNNAGILTGSFDRPSFADFSDHKATKDGVASAYVKALFDEVPEESFTDDFKVNAVGPYWFTIAFLPLLEAWKRAGAANQNPAAKKFAPQVIMTSSMNGWTKDAATAGFSFPYMFSKSAVGHAVASLAHELLPLDIRVNGIAPGLFPTEMAAPGSTNDLGIGTIDENSDVAFEVPVNRFCGSRHDMGTLALFLVANWFVNGETVLIDGGTLLKHPSSY